MRKPRIPECVPDDVKRDGVIWRSWSEVREEIAKFKRPLHPAVVKKLWDKWYKLKAEIDREWVAEQNARVEQIALEIDRDKMLTRLEVEEQKRRDYIAADHAENERWAKLLTEAQHRANKREERKLRKQIADDHAAIKRGLARKFGRRDPYHFPVTL